MKLQGQKLKTLLVLLLVASSLHLLLAQTTSISRKGDKVSIKTKSKHSSRNGLTGYDVEYEGDFELSDDDTDIISVSRGGYFEISKTTFGSKRRVLIESEGTSLNRIYYVGRKKTPYDPEGKEWLAEVLPEIVRSTGVGAKSRVNRFYKKGGVSAVLDEIGMLEGSYIKAIYANILLEKEGLSDDELVSTIRRVSDEVSSDYYLASILKDNSDRMLSSDVAASAYISAIDEIGSDYYAASVLTDAIENNRTSDGYTTTIIKATENIGSDYYLAQTLGEIVKEKDLTNEQISTLLDASDEISSDYYQSQLLSEVLEDENLSSTSYNSLLHAVTEVSSDHYMTSTFSKLLDNKVEDDVLVSILNIVRDDVSSDHYASSILRKVMDEQSFTDNSMRAFVEALKDLSSDHYATEVVKEASNNDELTDSQVILLLNGLDDIDSDHYLSTALAALAPRVSSSSSKVKEAYMNAVKGISSDTYYGRAIKAIN